MFISIVFQTSSGERRVATPAGKDVSEDMKSVFLFRAEVRRMHFNSSHHVESVHSERSRTAVIATILNSVNSQSILIVKETIITKKTVLCLLNLQWVFRVILE